MQSESNINGSPASGANHHRDSQGTPKALDNEGDEEPDDRPQRIRKSAANLIGSTTFERAMGGNIAPRAHNRRAHGKSLESRDFGGCEINRQIFGKKPTGSCPWLINGRGQNFRREPACLTGEPHKPCALQPSSFPAGRAARYPPPRHPRGDQSRRHLSPRHE